MPAPMIELLRRHPLTLKAALILGFGLVLGLWLLTGYAFTRRFDAVQTQAADLNERHLQAQDLLATVRGQILLGTMHVRDALLDPDSSALPAYRQLFDQAMSTADAALAQYRPIFGTADEQDRLDRTRTAFKSYQGTMANLLVAERDTSFDEVFTVLTSVVAPRRDAAIEAVERAQALNRAEFIEQQRTVATRFSGIQSSAWQQLGAVLLASLGVAFMAILYSGRLESRLRQQQARQEKTADELQRLSAKLISAQEDERRAIARELHDEIGQALMAIKVELAYTQRAIATTGGPGQLLDEAQRITDGVLRTVRDLSQLLHPSLLDDMGLPAAIDWYMGGFTRRYPIQTELQTDGMEERLPLDMETAIYRIVQEALTNVGKHSGAQTCRVRLRRSHGTILVRVEDDGSGFDAAAIARGRGRRGLGLIGIRERVAQLHGTFHLETSRETGTRLMVELPVGPTQTGAADDEGLPAGAAAGLAHRGELL